MPTKRSKSAKEANENATLSDRAFSGAFSARSAQQKRAQRLFPFRELLLIPRLGVEAESLGGREGTKCWNDVGSVWMNGVNLIQDAEPERRGAVPRGKLYCFA